MFAAVNAAGEAIPDSDPDIYLHDASWMDDLLIGNLLDTLFGTGASFSLLFQTTGGSAAAEFGSYFVATFTSDGARYESPSDIGNAPEGALRINAAVVNGVSEPATLPLLAIALAGGILARRRELRIRS